MDAAALAAGLAEVLGEGPVDDLRRLSGGASRETWSFRSGGRALVVQRVRGGALGTPMEVEDRLLAAAAAAGVPVPPVVADVEACRPALGPARITALVPGEALGPRLVRAERSDAGRRALARELGAALAAIHAVDPAAAPGLAPLDDPLERLRVGFDGLGEARPAFEVALLRLARTRPDPVPATVVHGDYRIGNLLVEGDALRGVLDWELAHVGDPREDLGWLCVRAWRFGGDHEVGGLADLDDVLAGYREAGGAEVAPEAVRWWTAVGTLTWGMICAVQARRHLDGHVRSVELATIGRRVVENEHDVLDLVAPEGGAAAAPPPPEADDDLGDHGRPSAADLVDAVAGHLHELRTDLLGAAAFHTKVAANALRIVERELRLGPALAAAHRARLAALGYGSDRELAAALRSGATPDSPEVVAAVRAGVVGRLQVANPRWLGSPEV